MTSQRDQDILLDQALDNRINAGALDDELVSLFEMASQVRAILAETPPPPHGLRPGRSAFLTAAAQQQATKRSLFAPFPGLSRISSWVVSIIVAIVLAILLSTLFISTGLWDLPVIPGESSASVTPTPTPTPSAIKTQTPADDASTPQQRAVRATKSIYEVPTFLLTQPTPTPGVAPSASPRALLKQQSSSTLQEVPPTISPTPTLEATATDAPSSPPAPQATVTPGSSMPTNTPTVAPTSAATPSGTTTPPSTPTPIHQLPTSTPTGSALQVTPPPLTATPLPPPATVKPTPPPTETPLPLFTALSPSPIE